MPLRKGPNEGRMMNKNTKEDHKSCEQFGQAVLLHNTNNLRFLRDLDQDIIESSENLRAMPLNKMNPAIAMLTLRVEELSK